MNEKLSLDIYMEGNKHVTTAVALEDRGGYWVPIYGELEWGYQYGNSSQKPKITVEYEWIAADALDI